MSSDFNGMAQNFPFFSAGVNTAAPTIHQQPSGRSLLANVSTQQGLNMPQPQHEAVAQGALLSGVDLSALAGVSPEQLAAIARLFQSGALPFPPQSSQPHVTQPNTNVEHVLDANSLASNLNFLPKEDVNMDMDKEDGEIEDGAVDEAVFKEQGFLRPPPTGPRNASRSPYTHAEPQRESRVVAKSPAHPSNRSGPRVTSKVDGPPPPRSPQNDSISRTRPLTRLNTNQKTQERNGMIDISKAFVVEIHKAGYKFDQLAKEFRNPNRLRHLFQQLGLPTSESKEVPPSGLSSETETKNSVQKRPILKPTAPKDRSEYLAKLQAAKNKKLESATAANSPIAIASSTISPLPTQITPTQTTLAIAKEAQPTSRPTPTGRANTELIRQRLEALKAEQAAKQNALLTSSSPGSSLNHRPVATSAETETQANHVGNGLADDATNISNFVYHMTSSTQPGSDENILPTQATLHRTPGLASDKIPSAVSQSNAHHGNASPGLMRDPGNHGSAFSHLPQKPSVALHAQVPTQSHSQTLQAQMQGPSLSSSTPSSGITQLDLSRSAHRKRAVASDFYEDDMPSLSDSQTPKRPFGQSRYENRDESLIITVSDDEDEDEDDDDDEGDEMDLDDSSDEDTSTETQQSISQKGSHGSGQYRQSLPPSSVSTTPGIPPIRPSVSALERTELELLNLRKALAEAERRKAASKLGSKSNIVTQRPLNVVSTLPRPAQTAGESNLTSSDGLSTRQEEETTLVAPTNGASQLLVQAVAPVPPTQASTREAEKERLRRRLQELEQARLQNGLRTTKNSGSQPPYAPLASKAIPGEGLQSSSNAIAQIGEQADNDTTSTSSYPSKNAVAVAVQEDPNTTNILTENEMLSLPVQKMADVSAIQFINPEMHVESKGEVSKDARADVHLPDSTSDHESEDDDDDLDNVYEQTNAEPPITRSLTSADVNGNNTITSGAKTIESPDHSSPEDIEDDDDLYEPRSAPTLTNFNSDLKVESVQVHDPLPHEPASSKAPEVSPPPSQFQQPFEDNVDPSTEAVSADMTSRVATTDVNPMKPAGLAARYSVYESPLSRFKDYRYHPQFLGTVPGGFQSLTYSHKIDPNTPLCVFEAAGGKCNDKTCAHQHFSDMGLSDNDLIRIMGMEHVSSMTPEDDKRWKDGLSAVVRQLRSTHLAKDVRAIAQSIADFRRAFVGDPTRTLHLD